jgi:cobalt-zinc-cadmium efflux system protein
MSRTQRLVVVLALNLGLVVGLVVAGVTAHSIAVLAEGSDFLLDAAGVGVALLAVRLSERPTSLARPEGYPKATSIAALINCGWLLALELLVASVAVNRLITGPHQVDGLPMLVVSSIAAVAMTISALILQADASDGDGGANGRDLSVAAVLLDSIADAAAAAGVAIAGGIILATGGWYWLDPAVALVVALVVAYHALALLRKVVSQLRAVDTAS